MKYKILVPAVLVLFVILGWYSVMDERVSQKIAYNDLVEQGDINSEKELYQQAYAYYEQAFEIEASVGLQNKILGAYRAFDMEQGSSDSQKQYLNALKQACMQFPEETSYWEEAIQVNLENGKYENAMSLCKEVEQKGLESEELLDLEQRVTYSYKLMGYSGTSYKNESNGYFLIKIGTRYARLTSDAEEYDTFQAIEVGSVGSEGIYLLEQLEDQIQFIDLDGIIRGKVKIDVTDFGMYSEGFCSVKYEDAYCFIDLDGNVLIDGLQYAGCFQNGKAVIQNSEGKWALIDSDGKVCSEYFEEIKVDDVGRYLFGESIVAKQDGRFQIYNDSLKKVTSKFVAEDVDIPVANGWLAFCIDGKWGYVNEKGDIQIEAQYEDAKSMSYGIAAVAEGNKWGFINIKNQLVIPYQFYDAGYMSEYGVCFVSERVDVYQALVFNFAKEFVQ